MSTEEGQKLKREIVVLSSTFYLNHVGPIPAAKLAILTLPSKNFVLVTDERMQSREPKKAFVGLRRLSKFPQ